MRDFLVAVAEGFAFVFAAGVLCVFVVFLYVLMN